MAVMAREGWTDERLDDLSERVGRLEVRVDAGFAEMRREFAAQNRMLLQLFVAMTIGFFGVIATILTQT